MTAPRLACDQCRSRKVRCNKDSPCLACKNAGLQCHTVQRARLPRGKSGKRRAQTNKLEDRVARIESLLAQSTQQSIDTPLATNGECFSNPDPKSNPPKKPGIPQAQYEPKASASECIAPEFWAALSEEVSGLRELLESCEDEFEEENHSNTSQPCETSSTPRTAAFMLGQPSPITSLSNSTQVPIFTINTQQNLLQLFRFRVDSVYKILHWPSVLSMIEGKNETTASILPILPIEALRSSIYFMAVCSMSAGEADEMGLSDRHSVLQLCQARVEEIFARSKLLHSPDIILLQAFVIYLVSQIRSHEPAKFTR